MHKNWINIGVKRIVYAKLKEIKLPRESLGEAIDRLIKKEVHKVQDNIIDQQNIKQDLPIQITPDK